MEKFEHNILSIDAKVLSDAAALKTSHAQVPVLSKYFPQNLNEYEVQEFNMNCTVPKRLKTAEEIAMWVLEKEELNRDNVARYLTSRQYAPANYGVTQKIAAKICSLEAAYGFAEGLKFFVPVIGVWDPTSGVSLNENQIINESLAAYVHAHLQHSKTPIFGGTSLDNIPTLVELAIGVLDLCAILYQDRKAQAVAMSDFFALIRAVLRKSPDKGLVLSVKAMTELFLAVSTGRPLAALKVPVTTPSYLFATSRFEGFISVGTEATNISSFNTYYAKVSADALYLFDTNGAAATAPVGNHFLCCIPLEHVNVQRGDGLILSSLMIELVHIANKQLSIIQFARSVYPGVGDASLQTDISIPSDVTYHKSIFLDVLMMESQQQQQQQQQPPVTQQRGTDYAFSSKIDTWFDALENTVWDFRHGNGRQ